jgi:sugar/nucleoside kinase (ribokinase family)
MFIHSQGELIKFKAPAKTDRQFFTMGINIDIIQVNETEVLSLYDSASELEIAVEVLKSGTKFLIVTKENKGAKLYYLKKDEIASVFTSALKVMVKNTVGCGDIFGAVFFHSFLKFGDEIRSLFLANTAAGIITSYSNTEDLTKFKDDVFKRYN